MDDLSTAAKSVFMESQQVDEGTPEVRGYDFNQGIDYEKMFDSYLTTGIQATHLARVIEEINKMIDERQKDVVHEVDSCFPYPPGRTKRALTLFLGYTSNMITSGLREIFRFLVQHDMVDCIVTSAGGVEEDIIKCIKPTYLGSFKMSGADLRQKGLNRAGNMLIPNENYCAFEEWLMPILDACLKEQQSSAENAVHWTPSKLIQRLGKEINHEESICYWAYKNKIPIFCPALTDGSLGDMLYFHSVRNEPGLRLDIVEDLRHINTMAVKSVKTGVVILGGGFVKHHINNANLMRNGSDYTVYINTGQEFDGSDSGAEPDEAVSWGKVKASNSAVKLVADATLVFPIVVARTFASNHHKQRTK
ncbi:deoxyhypusine synthase domain-containing protein [Ditylenchus destructor]|nr:deoxyhypusine synthase domain-containing protein [Ditylenchus destructor]